MARGTKIIPYEIYYVIPIGDNTLSRHSGWVVGCLRAPSSNPEEPRTRLSTVFASSVYAGCIGSSLNTQGREEETADSQATLQPRTIAYDIYKDLWQAMTESRQVQRQSNCSHKSTTKKSTNSWQPKQHAMSGSHFLDSSWRTAVMLLAFSLMHDREGMQTSVATTWCTFEQMMASSSAAGHDEDEQGGATISDDDMMVGCTSVDGNDGRDEQGSTTIATTTTDAELDAEMASSPFGCR
ncbi:hypothetical protein FOA52_004310 [Chlamydomonas sp. UWO 241]|nr:hypothetical protein FOA52_004310 [Chlamydomonas sp. UWO 241]